MITLPVTNRDLLRSIMATVPAAGIRYSDYRLQEAAEDEKLGMCTVNIVKLPEYKETVMIYDLDGTSRPHTTTRQAHEIQIKYNCPELQFMKSLEWGLA